MIFYTQWRIEKRHWAEYKLMQLIHNTKWRNEKWFCIESEELKNDVEYTMKHREMNLNIYNEVLRNGIVYTMKNREILLSGV